LIDFYKKINGWRYLARRYEWASLPCLRDILILWKKKREKKSEEKTAEIREKLLIFLRKMPVVVMTIYILWSCDYTQLRHQNRRSQNFEPIEHTWWSHMAIPLSTSTQGGNNSVLASSPSVSIISELFKKKYYLKKIDLFYFLIQY